MTTTADRTEAEPDAVTRHLRERLIAVYVDRFPIAEVERVVDAAHQQFAGARVRQFVPVLAEGAVHRMLDRRPPSQGTLPAEAHQGERAGRRRDEHPVNVLSEVPPRLADGG